MGVGGQVNLLGISAPYLLSVHCGFRFKFALARNTGLIALISIGDTSTES